MTAMRAQIGDLHARLQRVGAAEAALSARVASQDRKMAQLEGRLFSSSCETTTSSKLSSQVTLAPLTFYEQSVNV